MSSQSPTKNGSYVPTWSAFSENEPNEPNEKPDTDTASEMESESTPAPRESRKHPSERVRYKTKNDPDRRAREEMDSKRTPYELQPFNPASFIRPTVSLNAFFAQVVDDLPMVMEVLRSFTDRDDVRRILHHYDPAKTVDLDKLAKDAGIPQGDFRRMIMSCLDILRTDMAELFIQTAHADVVARSLEVAMDPNHPDSAAERRGYLELWGHRLVSKGVQTSITINNQQANGLPSFGSTMAGLEQQSNPRLKQLEPAANIIEMTTPAKKAKVRQK